MTKETKPADPKQRDKRPPAPDFREDRRTPGDQERPLTPEEDLDNAIDETFPASDPVSPRDIEGPSK